MSHYRRHTLIAGGCKAAPCGVLGRERTFQVRPLPAALPGALFARQTTSSAAGGDS